MEKNLLLVGHVMNIKIYRRTDADFFCFANSINIFKRQKAKASRRCHIW